MREKAGVDSQQLTGLAEPLLAALQEGLHFPVESHDLGEDFPRGYSRVRLREIGSGPGHRLDGVIACVCAGHPGHDVPGLICRTRALGWGPPARHFTRQHSLCLVQAEPLVQQLVPFGSEAEAFPAVDHPDQGIVDWKRGIPGSLAELSCQLGHLPSPGPPPCAQRLAADLRHRAYLRVAVTREVTRPGSRAFPGVPTGHYLTTTRYGWTGFTTLVRDGEGGVRHESGGRIECWPGNGARRCGLRYRDMEHVVLRGMMTAELRRRTSPPEGPADPAAAGAPR